MKLIPPTLAPHSEMDMSNICLRLTSENFEKLNSVMNLIIRNLIENEEINSNQLGNIITSTLTTFFANQLGDLIFLSFPHEDHESYIDHILDGAKQTIMASIKAKEND